MKGGTSIYRFYTVVTYGGGNDAMRMDEVGRRKFDTFLFALLYARSQVRNGSGKHASTIYHGSTADPLQTYVRSFESKVRREYLSKIARES